MQFCDLANNAGRQSKMHQVSRGLSAIAELLVRTTRLRHVQYLSLSHFVILFVVLIHFSLSLSTLWPKPHTTADQCALIDDV